MQFARLANTLLKTKKLPETITFLLVTLPTFDERARRNKFFAILVAKLFRLQLFHCTAFYFQAPVKTGIGSS